MTAGQWPASDPNQDEDLFHITRNLRVHTKTNTVAPLGQHGPLKDGNVTYTVSQHDSILFITRSTFLNTHTHTHRLSSGKLPTEERTGPTSFPMRETFISTISIALMRIIVLLLVRVSRTTDPRVPVLVSTSQLMERISSLFTQNRVQVRRV
jgi:hypothetical protein